MRAVNRFLAEHVDKVPLPKVYITKLVQVSSMDNVRNFASLEIKSSGAVIYLLMIISSAK